MNLANIKLLGVKKNREVKPDVSKKNLYTNSNFLLIEPRQILIKGFELKSKISRQVKITNVSTKVQRLNIVPSYNDEFDYFMTKKSSIAPGISQMVTVNFIPTKFIKYETNFKIQTENELLVVPIVALPVLNLEKTDIFPKIISFGWIQIGEVVRKSYRLESKLNILYPFEIVLESTCPDITITPMIGKIPEYGLVDIHIEFKPSSDEFYELKGNVRSAA